MTVPVLLKSDRTIGIFDAALVLKRSDFGHTPVMRVPEPGDQSARESGPAAGFHLSAHHPSSLLLPGLIRVVLLQELYP